MIVMFMIADRKYHKYYHQAEHDLPWRPCIGDRIALPCCMGDVGQLNEGEDCAEEAIVDSVAYHLPEILDGKDLGGILTAFCEIEWDPSVRPTNT